jgi:dimethylhistidine N-methyltransferase
MTARPSPLADAALPPPAGAAAALAADVATGFAMSPKRLPSRYLYDALGLALFEAICELPWYRLTRAERRLLEAHGGDLTRELDDVSRLVVLGAGNGDKVLRLLRRRRASASPLTVELIDFSSSALERAARALSGLSGSSGDTRASGSVTLVSRPYTYERGLEEAERAAPRSGRTLAAFFGSNIGNCDPPEALALLDRIRAAVGRRGTLLLGADLVKPEAALRLAYDDPLGVTAAFNRNVLVRLNRELGADFDVSSFAHLAWWNAAASRVEMHLRAISRQRVGIGALGITVVVEAGETIWTESSYKYAPEGLGRLLQQAGFTTREQWIDDDDRFALTLADAR